MIINGGYNGKDNKDLTLSPDHIAIDFDLLTAMTLPWKREASCVLPEEEDGVFDAVARKAHVDKFFPEQALHGGAHLLPARQICLECPVRMDCLAYGLNEAYGIWGGHSPTQRKRITRMVKSGSSLLEASQHIDRRSKDAR